MPPDAILFIADWLNWRPLCIGRPRPVYSDRNEADILLHATLRLPPTSRPARLPLARQGAPRVTLAAVTSQLLTSRPAQARSADPGCPANTKANKPRLEFISVRHSSYRFGAIQQSLAFNSSLRPARGSTGSRTHSQHSKPFDLHCVFGCTASVSWRPALCGAEASSLLPLLDEGPATGDGPHQALVGEHLDGSPHGHRGQARFLNQVDDARDLPPRRVHPGLDPLPQDGSQTCGTRTMGSCT